MLFVFNNGYSQTITAITVSPTSVCAGSTVTVTFTATSANGTIRHFTNGTTFIPYLSAVGGGATYTALPTFTEASLPASGSNFTSYTGLTTVITIPSGTAAGTVYKISLGCSGNPVIDGSTGANVSGNFTVTAPAVGGTVAGSATVCTGTNSTTLTLSGHTGSVSKWQYSPVSTFLSGVVDVTNTTTTLTATNLTATRYYRAVLVSGSCTANSSTGTVTVNPLPAGTLTNGGAVCSGVQPQLIFTASAGTGPFNLTINGQLYTGRTSGVAFTATGTAPTANTTYTLTNIVGANCTNASPTASTNVTVNQLPAGTLTNGGTVCSGTQPQLTFTASAGTGPFNLTINGQLYTGRTSGVAFTATGTAPTANTTYTLTNIVGANCSNTSAASTSVTVDPTFIGGSVAGGTTICSGYTSGVLTLTGNTGSVIRWEKSVSPFSVWTAITNTTSSHTSVALTETTRFRAVVQSGVCPEANSGFTTVTVESTTWNGTAWSNGTPTSGKGIVFSGNYTASSNLVGCNLTVTNNAVVSIPSGFSATIDGAVTVNSGSSLTFQNNANLLQNGTTNANSGNIIVKRNSSALIRQDYTLWSSPVAGQQLQSFSSQTLSNRFYTYGTSTNLYVPVSSPSTTNFSAASGYLIRMPNNHPATATIWEGTFTGVPNSGNYPFSMINDGSGKRFNLVGNPYPSPINATTFVEDNSTNITGTLYFWRKTNNAASPSYCSWSTAGFVTNSEAQVFDPNDVIRTGQGFFVEALDSSTTVNFTNSMRVDDTANQFFRSSNAIVRNRIWLNATGTGGLFSQTMVAYMTGATNGVDSGIDGRYINDGAIALTSTIASERYAIQGRALPFVNSDIVALNFTATTAGSYTIAIDHVDGLFNNPNQNIFLKDNATNTTHNLRESAYTFTAAAGSDSSRFELVYMALATFYQDFDNDGFGNAAVTIEAETAPTGYVIVAGDCDDTNQLVNPAAAEICYNNIDDNCDGTKSEGCAPVPVFVNNPGTLTSFSISLSALPYSYAGAITRDYRFEVKNMTTNEVREFTQTGTFARFFAIPTDIRGFGIQYQIRASAVINGEVVNYFVAPITVTSPGIPSTQLSSFSCNTTITRPGATISANPIPNTNYYRFRIRLTSDNGATPTYYYSQSTSRFIGCGSFAGLTLEDNTLYTVSVLYSMDNSGTEVISNYGAECTILTKFATTPSVVSRVVETPFTVVGYPNPFSSSFNIDVKSNSTATVNIKVYDMLGRIVEQRDTKANDLETVSIGNNLPNGVYNVIVAQDNEVNTLRMIKR